MQQQVHAGSFSMKQQQQQPTALRHSSSAASSDDYLFQTPSDLVCPITLSLFQDPVCNAAGQVYERAALQRHLLQAAVSGQPPTDPVSNAVLPALDLVPVWPMRSRAAEYRDSTIRACVHSAAAPDCADPLKYLRRAAELVLSTDPAGTSSSGRLRNSNSSSGLTPAHSFTAAASPRTSRSPANAASPAGDASPDAPATQSATGPKPAADRSAARPTALPVEASSNSGGSAGVPGLTVEFARYLSAHQSSQYDALVLKYFGNELLRAGCPDAASNVFYRLLLGAEDRVQQAEYLQLCLDCWTASSASSCGADSGDGDGGLTAVQQQQQAAPQAGDLLGQAASAPASSAIISKLADFVQRQRCLSPRAIVQMLQSTHHGSAMAMQLCQVLLVRAASAAAAAGPTGSAEAVLGLPGGLGGVLEVLLELVDLGHGHLLEQVQQLTQQVQQLQAAQAQTQHQAGPGGAAAASADGVEPGAAAPTSLKQQQAANSSEAADAAVKKRSRRCKGHSWRGGKGVDVLIGRMARVAAAGTLAVATLTQGNHPVLRLARAGPLLYLLRSGL